jgi:hypothetical protein
LFRERIPAILSASIQKIPEKILQGRVFLAPTEGGNAVYRPNRLRALPERISVSVAAGRRRLRSGSRIS